MVQAVQADGKWEWGWEEGDPGKKPRADPASYKALRRRTPPVGLGLGEVLWRVHTSLGEVGLGPLGGPQLEEGAPLGTLLLEELQAHPERGRLRVDTKRFCPGLEEGGPGRGEMVRKGEAPLVGLEWGVLAARRGAGALSACQVSAAAWDSPAQRSLSRAGTELVSRLAAPRGQGQEAAKRSGGQQRQA